MAEPLRFLIAESESPPEREARRGSVGRGSAETCVDLLRSLVPDTVCDVVRPAEEGGPAAADDITEALRRQADDLVKEGLARDRKAVETYAARLELLGQDPERRDVAWELGLGPEVTEAPRRQRELRNFIEHLVRPTRASRR